MATQTDICNMALGHIRAQSPVDLITVITETSNEAQACNLYYDQLLHELLVMHPWVFATKTVELAAHADDPPADWGYRYGKPADCLRPLAITTSSVTSQTDPIRYTLELNIAGTAETILCDIDDAWLRYTSSASDEAVFSPFFVAALGWRLAMEIAIPLTGSTELLQYCQAGFTSAINRATTVNYNQQTPKVPLAATAIRARSY